jgi:hypothetical protein
MKGASLILLAVIVVWSSKLCRIILCWLAPWRPVHLQPLNPTS